MANISSVGIGSGILTSDLIDQLSEAERAPTEARLNAKEELVTAEISAFGLLQSAVTEMRLPARLLGNPAAMRELTFESSSSAVSGSIGSGAQAGTYTLEVSALAQAQSLATNTFVDSNVTTVGTGTLTLAVGDDSVDIVLDNTNNTLEGLADAINSEEGIDATATIVDNGSGFQLVISSNQTGLSNDIEITVADDDGNSTDTSGLSQFVFNTVTSNLNQVIEAKDAEFKFNGIPITRSSNTVDDLLKGTIFELNSTNENSPATITIGEDTELVADRVEDFVTKFNELRTLVNELTEFNQSNPNESGLLLGDSTVRTINTQMRSLLSGVIPGLEGSSIRSLVDVGIETNKDTGLLDFNRSRFTTALKNNANDVVALFAEQGKTSDDQIEFVTKSINTKPGSYDIDVTQLATQGTFSGTKDINAGVMIDGDNDTFKIEVDGTESNDISLTLANYTATELVTELQQQINADTNLSAAGVSMVVGLDSSNQLTFTSTSYGSSSTVNFTSVDTDTLNDLGIDAIAGVDGLDVEGTINGQTAIGAGQQLSLSGDDDAAGLVVNVLGGATGNRGQATFIEGIGDRFVELVTGYIGVDGILTSRTDGLNAQMAEISEQRASLDVRVESLRSRLVQQFTSADLIINRLNSTADFISRQLAALDGSAQD